MPRTYKQLGQKRENSTNAVSVYSPAASTQTIIKSIIVTNTTASVAKVRVFVDSNGTTYDENTSIVWDAEVPGNKLMSMEITLCMNDSTGNLAYRSSIANALTVTVSGLEIT